MNEKDNGQVIQEDSNEPSNYAMIPKMAMMDLDPYELTLYCHYKITASEHGKCWKSNKTLATETGMSERKLQDVRANLALKGFIKLTPQADETGNINLPPIVTIVSKWSENRNRYGKKDVDPLAPHATPLAQSATPVAPHATKESVLESESLNKSFTRKKREQVSKPKADTIPAAQMNPMKDAIAAAFGWDWKTMTGQEKGIVQSTAKDLCTANFEPERVASFHAWCKAKFTHFTPKAFSSHLSEYRLARLDELNEPKRDKDGLTAHDRARLQHLEVTGELV